MAYLFHHPIKLSQHTGALVDGGAGTMAFLEVIRLPIRIQWLARAFFAALIWLGIIFPAHAQVLEPLTIVTSSGQRHVFSVEVMRNDEERAKGLMFRRHLPADRGMLFDFKRIEPVAMWMQNTYISLDMLFIRADGVITNIAQHTEPLSTRVVPSDGPVLSVLEVNAGTTARLGIAAGDKVEHILFKP
jgi:uncharacterized protein